MTRLYLISSIAVGAILLQVLVSRPPEVEWVDPSEDLAETTGTVPANSGNTPVIRDDRRPVMEDRLQVARNALKNFPVIPATTAADGTILRLQLKDGSHFDVEEAIIQSGKIEASLNGSTLLQVPVEQIADLERSAAVLQENPDPSLTLIQSIQNGASVSDEQIRRWLDSGEAEAFVGNYPHSSNRKLARLLNPEENRSAQNSSQNQEPIDTEELDEWMATVRDLMTRKVSSSRRTELVLEMDERLSQLNAQLTRSPANREKIVQFANRLRILKLDLIKSTGF